MLDTGCSRTCVRRGENFLTGLTTTNSNIRLICANNDFMETDGLIELSIKFTDNYSVKVQALVVSNLSTPIILGCDVIKSLTITAGSPYVLLNQHKLLLIDEKQPELVAYAAESSIVEPYSEQLVQVRNKFHKKTGTITIQTNSLQKQNNLNREYTVNSCLYKNTELISVLITNNTNKNVAFSKKQPVCTLQAIKLDTKCTAIQFVADTETESEIVSNFQSKREKIAERENFTPKIGSIGDLPTGRKQFVEDLIQKNRLAFSMGNKDIGKLAYFRFKLPFYNERETSYQPPRPIPINIREKVATEVDNWEELGIINKTQSGHNIPLIILKKPDGSIRISLDARELNQKLVPDRFPLPHIKTIFTKIGEKLTTGDQCFISTMDYNRGYWQVQVAETDRQKLAFSHNNRHFEATRMLYGTSTAPAAFARIMNSIFGDNDNFIVYLDDLIIVTPTFEEHVKSLKFLFETCRSHGILLSAKKCNLFATEIDFLGHNISKAGVRPMQKHKTAIGMFPRPHDRQSLKRFCGMANYNSRYVPGSSIIMSPLHKLCSSRNDFEWTEDHENAFLSIKEKLAEPDALFHRDPKLKLVLVNDASKSAVGSTLYQVPSTGNLEVIGYYSKKLTPPEEKRPMRTKELLAMAYGIKAFDCYLNGFHFRHQIRIVLLNERQIYK